MKKAQFLIDDVSNTVNLTMEISKSGGIDRERRIVSGFATLDTVDQAGDVITAEASKKAFDTFRGNVREQHNDKLAVGRVVSFEQKEYSDGKETGTGIYVHVYVSKGAQDTWEKVLDGTLSGFSVKGPIAPGGIKKQYIPESERYVRFITDYSLEELSLVDSPCHQSCNVLSIAKANGPATGIATGLDINYVMWCDHDKKAFIEKTFDATDCVACRGTLSNLGWFEAAEDENVSAEITKILKDAGKLETEEHVARGGSNMSKEVEKSNEEVEEVVETSGEVVKEEVKTEEPSFEAVTKALDEIKKSIERVSASDESRESTLASIQQTVEGVEKSVEDKMAELLEKHNQLSKEFADLKSDLGGVEKRLDSVENSTAIRKSETVANETEELKKSSGSGEKGLWKGTFSPPSFD